MLFKIVFVAAMLMIAVILGTMFTVIRENQRQHQYNTIDVIIMQRCVIYSNTYEDFDVCVTEKVSARVNK